MYPLGGRRAEGLLEGGRMVRSDDFVRALNVRHVLRWSVRHARVL